MFAERCLPEFSADTFPVDPFSVFGYCVPWPVSLRCTFITCGFTPAGSYAAVLRIIAACLLSVCIPGCKGDAKPTPDASVIVTGIVTMDAKPLDKAMVTFVPVDGAKQGNGGSGFTDSAGKYELSSQVGEKAIPGTPPGKYKVLISRMVRPDGTVADAMEPPMMTAAREMIPLQYSDYSGSTLTANVSTSGGTYNFEIKSK